MNSTNRLYAAMAAVLIMVVTVAYAYHVTTPMAMTDTSNGSVQNEANGSASSSTSKSSAAVSTSSVTLANYAFSPAHITVKVGTTVTWMNTDDVNHTVTVDKGMGPGSMLFGRDASYSYTFAKAGTYTYHCMPHPYMHGTVTVTQ